MKRQATLRPLVLAFAGLLLLTGASYGLSFAPLGVFEVPAALAIAGVKALLVVVFFMHLLEEGTSPLVGILTGLALMLVLVLFVAADQASRSLPPLLPPGPFAAPR